jgi:hypothetical protein
MAKPVPSGPQLQEPPLPGPDIDDNGVDRTQIREALALSPVERLRRLDRFMRQVIRIRQLNGWD